MNELDDAQDEHLRKVYKWNIAGLTLSWIIWAPLQSMARPYFQLYATELGATPIILAVISFVSTITVGFSRILGGYIADKYGRKKIVVYMTGVLSFHYLIYAFSPDWTWILIGAFLSSVALLYQPALWSIMSDSAPKEKRGKIFSLFNFLPSLLSSFSPILAIYFISQYTLVPAIRLVYLLTFVGGLIVFVVRLVFLKETLVKDTVKERINLSFKKAYAKALAFIKKNLLNILTIDIFFNAAVALSFLTAYYSVYFLGISEVDWGYIWIISSFLGLFMTIPMGFLIDKIGRKPVILFATASYLLSTILMFITPYTSYNAFILVLFAMCFDAIGLSSYFIVIQSIITDIVPVALRGRVNSINSLALSITNATVTLIAGAIYSFLGANIPYLVATIMTVLAILMITSKLQETK